MASLEQIEQVAELCQAADAAFVRIFDLPELVDTWDECNKKEWRERVFAWVMDRSGSTVSMIGDSVERTVLFNNICESIFGKVETSTLREIYGRPPAPDAAQLQRRSPSLVPEPAAEEGGWVTGPDGKNHWQGPMKPERTLRTATPDELARINARIAEAEKTKDGKS